MRETMLEGRDYEILKSGAVKMLVNLTVDDFCEMLDTWEMPKTSDVLIVMLKYKYDHDREWTYSNEIMEMRIGNSDYVWTWLNDWNEGQQQAFVLGWIELSDIDIVGGADGETD